MLKGKKKTGMISNKRTCKRLSNKSIIHCYFSQLLFSLAESNPNPNITPIQRKQFNNGENKKKLSPFVLFRQADVQIQNKRSSNIDGVGSL